MRFLVKASIPTEKCNAMMKDGTFIPKLESILADIRPEAVYFIEKCGMRTAVLIVNMNDVSEMPKVAEPFFLAFDAEINFHPVMLKEDLMKAAPHIEQAVKKYG